MKSIRFLAAGAALFLLASCGKEYNSVPGGNKGDNPLLPLGTADVAQIRYSRYGEKIRIYNAYRADTLNGTTTERQVVGVYTATNGTVETFIMTLPYADTVKKYFDRPDSIRVGIGIQNADDLDGSTLRVYNNQGVNPSNVGFWVSFSQMDSKVLRGSFGGTLIRRNPTTDTNDRIVIANGTFWVTK